MPGRIPSEWRDTEEEAFARASEVIAMVGGNWCIEICQRRDYGGLVKSPRTHYQYTLRLSKLSIRGTYRQGWHVKYDLTEDEQIVSISTNLKVALTEVLEKASAEIQDMQNRLNDLWVTVLPPSKEKT